MAAPGLRSMLAVDHGAGAGSLSGVGGSSGTGAGAALPPSFGLLPSCDQHKLQRLMSDEIEQLTELGSIFGPSEQRRSGQFWCLAAGCLGRPLEEVMLTGMFLQLEVDQEWDRLQQQKQQLQTGAAALQPDQASAAEDAAAAAKSGLLLLREQPQPNLTQQEPEPEQQPADGEQQHEAPASAQSANPAALAEQAAEVPSTSAWALTAAAAVVPRADAAGEEAAAPLLQNFAQAAAAEPEAPPPLNLLDLPGELVQKIFSLVPLSDRLTQLCCVNKRCLRLVNQLGLSGSCLCFDVSAQQKERTSKFLRNVRKLLARAQPEHQQLSVLIKRLPSPRSPLRLVEELDSDAQLRLAVRQPVQDMRHRLRCLTVLPMRKLALVDTERLPSHLPHLTNLESLSWEGEGPLEDPAVNGEWGRALAPLHQLTCLRWQPRPPPPGALAWRMDRWNELGTSPAVLASMARLHTLVWLPPRAVGALPNGAYLRSLHRLALPAQLAERSLAQLRQAAELRTLCLTGWEAVHRVQHVVEVVQQLPNLQRFAYDCAPAAEETTAAVAASVAALWQSRPELRIEDSTAACLAELQESN